jgi:hypothetical protein
MPGIQTAFAKLLSSPSILTAVGAVAIGGAVAGATIGNSPVLSKGIGTSLPEQRINYAADAGLGETGVHTPDHYPLVTPDGTIPVAQLSLRGRLRDTRGSWNAREPDYIPLDADHPGEYPDQYSEAELAALASWDPAPRDAPPKPSRVASVKVTRGSTGPAAPASPDTGPAAEAQGAPVRAAKTAPPTAEPASIPAASPTALPQPTG